MRSFRNSGRWPLVVSVVLILVGVVMPLHVSRAERPPGPGDIVQRAWQLAQESGAYRFTTEIVQTTYPAPALINVGRTSREDTLHIEGQTHLPERTLWMTLWKDSGSVLNPRDGVEVRVEGDRAYGRPVGGEWQEMDDFSGAFAPANDLLAYLVGARNVREIGTETRLIPGAEDTGHEVRYTRYAFDVDGPAFAEYLRDQMEQYLRERGELPAGLTLDSSDTFRGVTGQGEVWVDGRGLPRRLTIHLVYPRQQNGERVEADVQTDFFDFAPRFRAMSGDSGIPGVLRTALPRPLRDWQRAGRQATLTLGFLGLMAVLVVYSRSKRIYGIFVAVILLSMIIGPLLESHHVYAFYRRAADRSTESERRQRAAESADDLERDLVTSSWDPHRDPLGPAPSLPEGPAPNLPEGPAPNLPEEPIPSLVEGPAGAWDTPSRASLPAPWAPANRLAAAESAPDPDSDEDSDGLIHVQENRLGTASDNADSDGDQIRDDVEVRGFEWPVGSGERWYTDPNNPDTNNDGQTDTDECWSSYPPAGNPPFTTPCNRDTDADGIPDPFDTDNDDDGVPDRIDLSPYRRMGGANYAFRDNAPFQLIVNGLQQDYPVFVDLQLRPTEEAHLTYALNVLDWPAGDHDGQVQRHVTATVDSTFQTVAEARGDEYTAQDANGDVRLVPMVEITIPYDGSYGNLPVKPGAPPTRKRDDALDSWLDVDALAAYGISVREKDDDGTLAVYVPLNVVSDETGGGRVAFSARMLYSPGTASWGDAHEVRVVWLVLMLTDSCAPVPLGTSEAEAETWCDGVTNWVLNRQQPVHTYTEDWYLTGLAVREDHGLDVAVALEDPDDDVDTRHDDHLWLLANGLEAAFVSGRDADENDVRDVAIAPARGDTTISSRFDGDEVTAGTTITDRWGIPLTATLQVETFSYDHQDYIAHVMMTETKNILNAYFTSATGETKADAPTLLFAREERYRSVNFDDTDVAAVNGRQLTVGASPANAQEVTLALVSWAPFRHRDGAWESYPFTEYWDLMEVRFEEVFAPDDPDDPDSVYVALGEVALAKAYYLSIFNGITGMVWIGENRVWQFSEEQIDTSLAEMIWRTGKGLSKGAKAVVANLAEGAFEYIASWSPVVMKQAGLSEAKLFCLYVGMKIRGGSGGASSILSKLGTLKTKLSGLGKVGLALAATGAIVAVGATIAFIALGESVGDVIGRVFAVVALVVAIKNVIQHGKIFLENIARLAMGLKLVKSITKAQMKAGLVGLIVAAVVTFGAFIVSWIVSGVSFWSVAFNTMLAEAIATVVVATIMVAIMGIPIVGQIIAAIIALIDAVILTLCTAFGWGEGRVGQWVCKGIQGLAAEGIKRIIYGNHVMIDMEADDRLDVQNFQQDVFDPGKGIAVGNHLAMGATVTTTIELSDVPGNWMAYAYYWQYSRGTLESATFSYALQTAQDDIHDSLSRGQIADWADTPDVTDDKVYIVRDIATDGSAVSLADAGAGINRPVALYLSEGQAIPSQECWAAPVPPFWGVPPVPCPVPPCTLAPVCYIRTEKKTVHVDLGTYFRYDIFPETLDDFYAPGEKDGGYSLAWGQDTAITSTVLGGAALTFPRQVDLDGDGLYNPADGGSDPDDRFWDLDGDGLSDFFESEVGSDPTLFDTDGDGMHDGEEARLGTDPYRRDSDSDGLTDLEEIAGWEFVYAFDDGGAPLTTWVTSDPADADGDGDGLTDFQEKTFGFNPRAYSDPHVLAFESRVSEAGAPHLLLRFEESLGAAAFADVSGYGNVATCDAEGNTCPTAGVEGRHGHTLLFDGVDDLLVVPDSADLDLTTFSIGAWVRPTEAKTSYQPIITKQDAGGRHQNYGLFIMPNSMRIHFSFYAGNCSTSVSFESAGSLPLDQWTHVMITYNGRRFKVYLDGSQDTDVRMATSLCQNDEPVKIGHEPGRSAPFAGRIDEVAIFDHALAQAEVRAVMGGRYNPQDMFVGEGDTLDYQATVKNELFNRYAQGLLRTDMPGLLSGDVPPTTFVLQPQEEAVMVGSVDVISPAVASAQADLTQVAGVLITDWREQSDFAEIWLRLDEEPGAATFFDYSGTIPPRSGTCSGSRCPQSGDSGVFGYALQFDGNDDRVALPTAETLKLKDTSFTVSAWVKDDRFSSGDETVLGTDAQVTNRGLFLGVRNGRPWMSFYNNDLNSGYTLSTGDWHHLAFRYDRVSQEMAIFVDGEQRAAETGHDPFQGTATVHLGRSRGSSDFEGWIDDVRVFGRTLSAEEIRALYTLPVFRMAFEEPSGAATFVDGSGFGSFGVCGPISCPGREGGVNGRSARFNGNDYVAVVSPAPALLDMSEGKFTLSTWVYPTNSGNSTVDNYVQGILGKYSSHVDTDDAGGDDEAYPTLLRMGRKLRFGFGTGSTWVWRTTSDDVLKAGAWNHVVATFGPVYDTAGSFAGNVATLYVDGQVVGSWNLGSVRPTANTQHFYIGRANDTGRVYLDRIYVDEEGDGAGDAELYIEWEGSEIWREDDADQGESLPIGQNLDYTTVATLRVWEDDWFGDGEVGADDELIKRTFTTHQVGRSDLTSIAGEGGAGPTEVTLYLSYPNSAIPFRGRIDETVIYKRPLNEDEVASLYYAGASGLHLRLDDAPGSTSFENAAGPNTGACMYSPEATNNACPTTGVPGRINQAALFDGTNDYIDVALDVSETRYATSLWFKTEGTCAGCGIFSVDKGTRGDQGSDRHIYLNASGDLCARVWSDETICTSGQDYADDAWHHVVHTLGTASEEDPRMLLHMDAGQSGSRAFSYQVYDNRDLIGTPIDTGSTDWPLDYDWSDNSAFDNVSIRWTGDFYFPTGVYVFTARSDDGIRVYVDGVLVISDWSTHSAKDYAVAWPLTQGLHTVKVEYFQGGGDAELEFRWSPMFRDSSANEFHATCAGSGCPRSVAGKFGRSLRFDGVDDWVAGPDFDIADDFTLSLWVDPDTTDDGQALISKHTFDGSNLIVFGLYDGGYQFNLRGAVHEAGTKTTGWQHLVVVGHKTGPSTTQVTVYKDGRPLWEQALNSVVGNVVSGRGWAIGQEWDANATSDHFDGRIDEVAIYNRALSLDDVEELYASHRLYVDGAFAAAGTKSASDFGGQTGVNVGFSGDAVHEYFAGRIDDVRVFHQALGSSDVEALLGSAPQFQLRLDESVPACAFRTTYYTNTTLSGAPAFERCEDWPINHAWGAGGPGEGVIHLTDNFGARWTGDFYFPEDDVYTFVARTRDGVQVWVDGVRIINEWTNTTLNTFTADRALDQGVHTVEMAYRELTGGALAQLYWEPFFMDDSGNDNHGACGSAAACPAVGSAGQVGLAAEFDGRDDIILVADDAALRQSTFSVGGWVKPISYKNGYQPIIARENESGGERNYGLFIKPNSTQVHFSFLADDCATAHSYDSVGSLVLNGWNHVMMTYDGTSLDLYLNGYLDRSVSVGAGGGVCQRDVPLKIGDEVAAFTPFAGRVDEVTVYDHALSARDVRDVFLYQGKWVEERQSHTISVDADAPTSTLRSIRTDAPDYRANRYVEMHVGAQDATSGVALVELGVMKDGQSGYTWFSVPRCDGASDAAWCPGFDPTRLGGEGRYTLQTRAIDRVGNRETLGAAHTLYVDASPPQAATGLSGLQFAAPHPSRRNAWTVPLSGTVVDPPLSSGDPGSGVAADTVRVTLYAADGAPAGSAYQVPVVTGNDWAVDYVLPGGALTDTYTIVVEAADEQGNRAAAQLATIQVDAAPPAVYADVSGLPAAIFDPISLQGGATDRPAALAVTWTTDGQGDQVGLALRCGETTLHQVPAGLLAPRVETYTWNGLAHRGASCQVDVTDSAGDGGTSGEVTVCGSPVASWSAGYGSDHTVSFTADAAACGPALPTAGVEEVAVAFVPTLPDAPLYNPPAPEGEVLHLPFEGQPDETGGIDFQDVAAHLAGGGNGGRGHDGTCAGTSCPTTGQAGPSGNAVLFDGVDDSVRVADPADHVFFTVSAWVHRTGANAGRETIVDMGCGVVLSLNEDRWGGAGRQYPGIQAYYDAFLRQPQPVPLGQWVHLAATRGRDNYLRLYRDGQQVAAVPLGWVSTDCDHPTIVGGDRSQTGHFFPGLIDEVRVFDRALSAEEIRDLYHGAGPAVALALDEAWATADTVLDDATGRQHHGTLDTGSGDVDNKARPGQAGAYALALDGIDDHAVVAPHAGLRLDHGRFTLAAWVYPTPEHAGRYPILDSGAYHVPGYRYPFLHVVNRTQIQAGFGDGGGINTFTTGDVLTENQWSHVVATFDGTTYTLYVDGVERMATDQFAGQRPHSSRRFDVGRGTDTGGAYACARVSGVTFEADWSLYGYRVTFNGERIWVGRVPPGLVLSILEQPIDFCGSGDLVVERNYLGQWISMGTETITATLGTGSHTFTGVGKSATVSWDTTGALDQLHYFRGRVDDVRVYPRALSELEVASLHNNGWRAAALVSGAGTSRADWTAQVPTGLEGPYRIDLRGRDAAGHVNAGTTYPGADGGGRGAWQGDVDTLAPRVELMQEPAGVGYQYTAVARDMNLDEASFRSPCGAGTATEYGYFEDPVYLARSGQAAASSRRLYQMTAVCVADPNRRDVVGAYDTPGLARDAVVSGTYAYVADGLGGLRVIDVSDPTGPRAVGVYNVPGFDAQAVVISGTSPTRRVAPVSPASLDGAPAGGVAPDDPGTPLPNHSLDAPGRTPGDARTVQDVRDALAGGGESTSVPSPRERDGVGGSITSEGSAGLAADWLDLAYKVDVPAAERGGPVNRPLLQAEDVLVEDVSVAPPAPGLHQPFTVTVVVGNQSTTSVGVNFWTGVYADVVPADCDACTESWDCANVPAPLGAGLTTTLVFTHPGFTRVGDHALYAQADSYCVLFDDPNLANNTYGPVTITIPFLTVSATHPAGNGLSVPRHGVISATFNQAISVSTVTTRTFAVRGRQTGVYTGSYSISSGGVSFDALPDYKPGEEVVVSLSDAIRGLDDSWLLPHTWQFWAGVGGGTGIFTASGRTLGSTWPLYEIDLADLDGDGDLDALVDASPVEVWLNEGGAQGGTPGTFTDTGQSLGGSYLEAVALGDLDGDTDLDAFVGNSGFPGQPNHVWLNEGGAQGGAPGVFTDTGQSLGSGDTWSVALGDLDGDGDLDAYVGNVGTDRIWLNEGGAQGGAPGTFTDTGQSLGSGETFDLALGDVDGDGDLDALANTQVWLNEGGAQGGTPGTFTDSGQTLGSIIPYATALVDLDGDGDLDVVHGDNIGDQYIWINDGTGVFTNTDMIMAGCCNSPSAFGDVDWDGDLDALLGDGLWLNDGTAVFMYSRSLGISDTVAVALGDLDGDGDLDAVLSGPDAGTGIMLNNPHPPTAVADSFAVPPDSSANVLNVLANDTDADGDAITLAAVGAPDQGGSVAISGTAHISYTPLGGFFGLEVLTYTIRDAGRAAGTTPVTITVGGANDPPTVQDDSAGTDEDTPVTIDVLANDTDPNGQSVMLASVGAPTHGGTAVEGQAVTYTPAPDFNGTDSFTYVATDGWLTGTGTVTVTVAPVNDPPVFVKGPDQAVAEDSGLRVVPGWATSIRPGPAAAVDEVGQALTFTLVSDNAGLFALPPALSAAGTLSFTPAADANGRAGVTVTLRDGGGTAAGGDDTSSPQTFVITVTAVNDRPVAGGAARSTPEDTPLSVAASELAGDVDGDALAVVAVGTPVSGTAVPAGDGMVYTPALNLDYEEAFTYTVSDPGGLTDTATITVTVTPVNDPPTLDALGDLALSEDGPRQTVALSGITSGAFNEAQALTVTAHSTNTALIPHPTVTYASPDATGSLDLGPTSNRFGVAALTVDVTDGLSTTTRSFWVTVAPVNDPPTLDPIPDLELYVDAGLQTVTLGGIGAGPYESQRLTVTAHSTNTALIPQPTVTYVSPNAAGFLRFTPVAGQTGAATVVVTITDGLSEIVRPFRVIVYPSPTRFAYVASNEAGLRVVDVTTPHHPRLLGSYDTPGYAKGVAVSGTHVYVADWHRGLRVVDVSDPAHPQPVGSYDTFGFANDVALLGAYAYVADVGSGLRIIDVSDPTNPQEVGAYAPSSLAVLGVTVSDSAGHPYAYLATQADGLLILDVSNPASPQLEGSTGSWWGWDVVISGGYAYVGGGSRGLRIVDVTEPAQPQVVSRADTPGSARGLDVSGGFVYVADEVAGLQVVDLAPPSAPTATACDKFGHCTTVGATPVRAAQPAAGDAPYASVPYADALYASAASPAVSFLGVPSLLDTADPLSITVEAAAVTATLRALTVTVDAAAPLYTETWASGSVTRVVRSVAWTPSGEGAHVLRATAVDGDDRAASAVVTVTLDTEPPTIGIKPTVLTATHFHSPRTLDLMGWVSDTSGSTTSGGYNPSGGVSSVYVAASGYLSGAVAAGIVDGVWRAPLYLGQGTLPDGEPAALTARATDVVGHETVVTGTVLVDVVPPTPVTLGLRGGGAPLAPGATVRAVSPTLALTWTAASDGSGLAGYVVDWAVAGVGRDASGLTLTHHVSRVVDLSSRSAQYTAGDAQKVVVQVASRDVHGNERRQAVGPIYVDGPYTPDYVVMKAGADTIHPGDDIYHGWMEGRCALVGVDRRVDRNTADPAALSVEQRFYATWNEEALRLAWTGANWNTDGDLFIYLDTRPGGVITAVNPYQAAVTSTVYLPGATPISQTAAMAADYLVWVWDSGTALLLEWSGGAWDLAETLTADQYRFDPARRDGLTDLYLPFGQIGITDAVSATLDLVAFATEGGYTTPGGLRLWATMPSGNALNSERVMRTSAGADVGAGDFGLSHRYHWEGLGSGVCPNGSDGSTPDRYTDADVQVTVTPDPAGAVYSFLEDDLFWLWDVLLGDRQADVSSFLASGDHPEVSDGRGITYTIYYHNRGTFTATGVYADVAAHYALRLSDPGGGPDLDHRVVSMGTIGPGERGSASFRGRVNYDYCWGTLRLEDCGWAAADVLIHDDAHAPGGPPLDWIWIDHRVDGRGPEFFDIQLPAYLVAAGQNTLSGYAYDAAGVPTMTVEVEDDGAFTCPDATPDDGQWSCGWDTTDRSHGDVLNVRLRAADGHGQESVWSGWRPFLVDARPPTITLDVTATGISSGSLVRDSAFTLVGGISDDGGVEGVDVCVETGQDQPADCGQAALQVADEAGRAAVVYEDVPALPVTIDGTAACGGGEILRTFPVTESFAVGEVRLGLNVAHAHRDDLHVTLQSPAGTVVWVLYDDGLSGTRFQNYDVLLADAATVGPNGARADDDPAPPYYDRQARPYEPLRVLEGEDASGPWTLRICDLNPSTADGAYHRSRLVLTPRQAEARSGRWSYQAPGVEDLDHVTQTLTVYGMDVVGNRTVDPVRLDVTVDNVPPRLTATDLMTTVTPTIKAGVLSGTVADGGGVSAVFVVVQTPAGAHTTRGEVYQEPVAWEGTTWSYDLEAVFDGRYRLWVNASDRAGNVTTAGPFEVTVLSWLRSVYLPLVMQNWSGPTWEIWLPVVVRE